MGLIVIKAKPNPAGKDRLGNQAPQQQLAGEWVDISNSGNLSEDLTNIQLYHWAYQYPEPKWELVIKFSGALPAGESMRVHSGGKIPLDQLLAVDRQGADHHLFSGKGYVWNNDEEDKPTLWNAKTEKYVDKTTYDANPPEGKVLQRLGQKLV